jgi:hypothetical protein
VKIEIVDQWWLALRTSASAWVISFWGGVGALIVAIWPVAQWVIDQILPRDPLWRIPFALLTLVITSGSMLFARVVRQRKRQQKLLEKRSGK